jgi:predicted aldo/keto reductase-like oxidoreductase
MQYRSDPRSGNKLSVLGYGCMRFPRRLGAIDLAATERLIIDAVAGGVNYFDTAYIYPGSEETLGAVLTRNNLRDKVYIATKLPLTLVHAPSDFEKYFAAHLARLKTEHIDYYLLHMLTDFAGFERLRSWGVLDWAAQLKAEGKIRQFGFSFHGTRDAFLRIIEAAPWDFCQIQYNYSDENFQAGVTGLRKAASLGLPVMIMEPLLGGKLAQGLPGGAAKIFHDTDSAKSNAAWAFNWLFDQKEVTVVLSGMNNEDALRENLALADKAQPGMLSMEEKAVYAKALAAFNEAMKIRCTGCSYCMPCPHGVNIPGSFAAYNTSYFHGLYTGLKQYTTGAAPLSQKPTFASNCVKCGACEKHCPQKLPIRDDLARVKARLEPWWYQMGMHAARRLLGCLTIRGEKC